MRRRPRAAEPVDEGPVTDASRDERMTEGMAARDAAAQDAGAASGAGGAGGGTAPPPALDDLEAVRRLQSAYQRVCEETRKIIVGQRRVVEQLMITIFARGHCRIVGVPGLAKTLLVQTVARCLSLRFNRIQFTPDLMPSDITGTEVIQEDRATGERHFRFLEGPIFANVILADEINRTPPKTQAALLEAMQEHQVTAAGQKHPLPEPFFVFATQNPIEQEGTYPLPEAQLDRFMFDIAMGYPGADDEYEIVRVASRIDLDSIEPVLTGEEILALQRTVRRVPIADHVVHYAMRLVRSTRHRTEEAPPFIKELLSWGAGPRATQYLILGGKARAILHGRTYVSCEDIAAVAHPVLRHRIITNFNAEAEGITPDDIIDRLLAHVPQHEPVAVAAGTPAGAGR
ncbi:MAG: ATPase AAA [Planctomycetota bacterium]|nr:MAG: ATPase AAA [Planctomycetota bacterium]